MNLIDIVKNAPKGAERYKVFFGEKCINYYAIINGVKSFYSLSDKHWVSCHDSSFDLSLPLPKIKTEYKQDKRRVWDLEDDFNAGELYHKFERSRKFVKIENIETLAQAVNQSKCYLRIDKIIDERDEFVCKLFDLVGEHMSTHEDQSTLPSFLYSKGCRFID